MVGKLIANLPSRTHNKKPRWVVCTHQARVSPRVLSPTEGLSPLGLSSQATTSRTRSTSWPRRVLLPPRYVIDVGNFKDFQIACYKLRVVSKLPRHFFGKRMQNQLYHSIFLVVLISFCDRIMPDFTLFMPRV